MKNEHLKEKITELDKNSIKYLLIRSNYVFRKDLLDSIPTQAAKDATFQGNIGSALFVYDGKFFGPFPAASRGRHFGFEGHSERESLLGLINEAITEGLKPFENLPRLLALPIKKTEETEYANLINLLEKLDEIHILSERKSCDYRENPAYKSAADKGRAPYLEQLDIDLGNNKITSTTILKDIWTLYLS